jgi:lipid-A-disaccharide synthase-like uncharacterized protein
MTPTFTMLFRPGTALLHLAQLPQSGAALAPPDADVRWLIAGLASQAVIALCLAIHLLVSRRRKRFVIPQVLAWLATLATLVLMIYAAGRRDLVFTLGQFVNVLICLRLLGWIHRPRSTSAPSAPRSFEEEDSSFPVIAPHQAERRIKPAEPDSK